MSKQRMLRAFAIMLVCIFSLSGCKKQVGSPEDNAVKEETEEDTEKEEEGYTFGFSGIDMGNPYFITLESAVREALDKEGNTLITMDPEGDSQKQNEQIQEMIEDGIDAIFVSPVNWEEITPSLQALKEAGVKIINIDTQVKEMDYVDAYIGSDNHNAGYICGEDLITRCPEGGKVLILECPTQNSINDRITGFEEAISTAEHGFEIVDRIDTGGEFEKSLKAAQEALKEHPEITAIMCGNDQIAVGATTAVNLDESSEVIIYGVDGSPDIKKELKKANSHIAGTAGQSPINMGKTAAKIGINVLEGNEYEKETYEEVFMIDKYNVDMYGVDGWQ